MADDSLTITIDEAGRVLVESRAALRRLAARPGRYRLIPSSGNLVILEKVPDAADTAQGGHIVMSGDIDRVGGLVDVLQFVATNQWSGQLAVLDHNARKTIFFKQGDVTTAGSNVPEDKIGALLYRYGMISAEDLDRTLAQVTQENRLGQILVEKGLLSAHDLYQFVRKQVEEIFFSVLAMREGEYYFYRTPSEAGPPSQLQLSTKQLLFDGVRRLDEMVYFREKIPSSEAVLVARVSQPPEKLPPREHRVFALIDGRRDVGAVARESRLGEFEATKILFQFVCAGWVQAMEAAEPRPPDQETAVHLLETFNQAYARVHQTVSGQGKLQALSRGVDSFFESVTEFAPLFVGISLDGEGRLPRDMLLANLDMAPTENKVDYLYRGLNELLRFVLFVAGEGIERDAHSELHQRLNQILRDLPARLKESTA